jgi:alkyl sulfatase BDS1-like metallo-beta-lactamase superfamily hydrolase
VPLDVDDAAKQDSLVGSRAWPSELCCPCRSAFDGAFSPSVSHNVEAIYQRYLGWYDGNPARLWQHPPQEKAGRYVEFTGGADEVVAKARHSVQEGDLR